PARTRGPVPPIVNRTQEAVSRISNPTYRLKRSPARNALDTPAVKMRKVGWKIETGCCGDSSLPTPCADENSKTIITTIDETTSMSAEKRSTTREMAMGDSQPPSRTASAPP